MVKLYNQYKEKGFVVIAVNVRDNPGEVQAFLRKYGANFVGVINGSPTDVAQLYGVNGTPRNFVINGEGQIVADITGYAAGDRRVDAGLRKAGLED